MVWLIFFLRLCFGTCGKKKEIREGNIMREMLKKTDYFLLFSFAKKINFFVWFRRKRKENDNII